MLAAILAMQRLWFGRYSATSGHAAGHLGNATLAFGMTFIIAVLVWAAPSQIRRRVELWILSAAVLLSGFFATAGNLRVVDAIGNNNWSDPQAGSLGPSRPGFSSGHDLAERSSLIIVACAVLLAVWMLRRHAVATRVGIAAIVLNIIVPYWMFPGFGIIVIATAFVLAKAQRLQLNRSDDSPFAMPLQ